MYRQIVIPQNTQLMLQLPVEFVGKQVEVIAFELDTDDIIEKKPKQQPIDKIFDRFRTDMSNFKFDRNEANDYD